jgi:hypothetical protein
MLAKNKLHHENDRRRRLAVLRLPNNSSLGEALLRIWSQNRAMSVQPLAGWRPAVCLQANGELLIKKERRVLPSLAAPCVRCWRKSQALGLRF